MYCMSDIPAGTCINHTNLTDEGYELNKSNRMKHTCVRFGICREDWAPQCLRGNWVTRNRAES